METITGTDLPGLKEASNLAETLAREFKTPVEMPESNDPDIKRIAIPPGWNLITIDDEKLNNIPRRKTANVRLSDTDSFIDYVKRHGSLARATIWCMANFVQNSIVLSAILNDHGEEEHESAWRDHIATYRPAFSVEWTRWTVSDKKKFEQREFAEFIEENCKDIAGGEGRPSGREMLEMALAFEANQEARFKSAIRLQNGGISMSFVQDDNDHTVQQMQAFDRFDIGIPVFQTSPLTESEQEVTAYRIGARMRYRATGGKLIFWYELIRPDKVLEDAARALLKYVQDKTGNPFFFGEPFAK